MFQTMIRGLVGAVAVLAMLAGGAQAQGLAGAYLAGNQANRDKDYEQAAKYYAEALSRDPSNPFLLQNALLAFIGKGDVDRAVAIARKVASGQIGNQLADLVLVAEAIKLNDYDEAAAVLSDGADRFSPLLAGLLSMVIFRRLRWRSSSP